MPTRSITIEFDFVCVSFWSNSESENDPTLTDCQSITYTKLRICIIQKSSFISFISFIIHVASHAPTVSIAKPHAPARPHQFTYTRRDALLTDANRRPMPGELKRAVQLHRCDAIRWRCTHQHTKKMDMSIHLQTGTLFGITTTAARWLWGS